MIWRVWGQLIEEEGAIEERVAGLQMEPKTHDSLETNAEGKIVALGWGSTVKRIHHCFNTHFLLQLELILH